jgi:hypothetical protein
MFPNVGDAAPHLHLKAAMQQAALLLQQVLALLLHRTFGS